mgnify:CR=1 FL=1
MTIKPLADKVVVKVEEAEQTTASGIVLSTSAQEKPAFATVVAVGPGGVVDGEKVEMTVKVGDKVVTSNTLSFHSQIFLLLLNKKRG